MKLSDLHQDESLRNNLFPVTRHQVFMANAGVAPIPQPAADAIQDYMQRGLNGDQEGKWTWPILAECRRLAALLLGGKATEVSLLGPTSLGLSMVAHGLEWQAGDEIVYYADDYPANVYPWTGLASKGVITRAVQPTGLGAITWSDVEAALTEKTRLVALASCNFLSGYRLPMDEIGRELRRRDILFSVDGIQTVGAFATPVEHVDFLSADSHKWMLGPAGAGIFYVSERSRERLQPILRGAWNIESPEFISQSTLTYQAGGRRYEPGTLNTPGIVGMAASLALLVDLGLENISAYLLQVREALLNPLREQGFELCGGVAEADGELPMAARSAIVSVRHPQRDAKELFGKLEEQGIICSVRHTRDGEAFLRFSPHVFNTLEEVQRVVAAIQSAA